MANRYFGFNSLAGCARTSISIAENTTAGRFDSTYVANAILVGNSGDYAQVKAPFIDGTTSLTGTFYFRADVWGPNFNGSQPMVFMLNGGANAYRIAPSSTNAVQMQYWNSGSSAWVNWGSAAAITNSVLATMMLKLTPNVGYEIYVAGSLAASSAVVPTNGAAAVDEFRLMGANSTSSGVFFSQIMCADYDISGSHLFPTLPTGNGTYTDGTGSASDVGETVLDDGTAIALPAVGNKHTFTKPAVPTIPSGLTIAGMVVNARCRVGGGTVTDGKIKIRSSSADATSGGKSVGSIYGPRGHFFATDPNTGTTWGKSGFDAAEIGLEAA